MVNNFEQIKSMFYFNEGDNMFFHCQIVSRAKDHKGENEKVKEVEFISKQQPLQS